MFKENEQLQEKGMVVKKGTENISKSAPLFFLLILNFKEDWLFPSHLWLYWGKGRLKRKAKY